MQIVTFNLRCIYKSDGVNSFVHRAGMILDTIREKDPEILCFQEATEKNMDFLRKYLAPAYTVLFTQREPGLTGEGLAVAFRQDAVSLYGLEVFWLSPTPDVVASKYPGQSQHSRICQKLWFKNAKTGTCFRIYNLHLEELSEDVRLLQAQQVAKRLDDETMPYFVLGDFNTVPSGKVYPWLLEQGLKDVTAEIPVSFHGFGTRQPPYKLDYVFTDAATAEKCRSEAWDTCLNGIYLSDHYPIALHYEM